MSVKSLVRQTPKVFAFTISLVSACLLLRPVLAQDETVHYRYEPREVTWTVPQSPDPANPSEAVLSWKFGPTVINNAANIFGDPVYFQLTTDYTIDLNHYLDQYEQNDFHGDETDLLTDGKLVGVNGCGDPHIAKLRDLLTAYDYRWQEQLPDGASYDRIAIESGVVTLGEGYRWDGPTIDSPFSAFPISGILFSGRKNLVQEGDRMLPKHSSLMRASLVHDAFYDLLREGNWPLELSGNVSNQFREDFRHMGDCVFYMLAMQDYAMDYYTTFSYRILQKHGTAKANGVANPNSDWKHHAIAIAGDDQQIACASDGVGETVSLDGSESLFATTHVWEIDGVTVASAKADVELMPGQYIAKLTVSDGDDDQPHDLFCDTDKVSIVVAEDTEPPIFRPIGDILAYASAGEVAQRVYFDIVADDDCGTPAVMCSRNPGLWFLVGTTPVSCTAEDSSGNKATTSFNVTVNKTERYTSPGGSGSMSWISLTFLLTLVLVSAARTTRMRK